jgi:hypothetical protein
MTPVRYASPEAFKQALEERIRQSCRDTNDDIGRFRQLLVFDRFLARLSVALGDRVIVKGGVVLELRLARARTTRDVDLRLLGDPDHLLADLQAAGRLDLGDFLTFEVAPDREHPTLDGDGLVYGGQRLRAEARLAGKLYGMPFGVDAGFGDVLTVEPDLVGNRFLDFLGIEPSRLRLYPREAHVAEKLHAYSLPRPRESSRVKDLPDLGLLAQTGPFDAEQLRHAIEETFRFRATHPLPTHLAPPPASWAPVYARMATNDALRWAVLDEVELAVRSFVDPLLGGATGSWSPSTWRWMP